MTLGDSIKVSLPGETPWAEVVALHDDETWDGRILNRLIPEMDDLEHARLVKDMWGKGRRLPRLHSFKQGDVVRFRREVTDEYDIWVPATAVLTDFNGHGGEQWVMTGSRPSRLKSNRAAYASTSMASIWAPRATRPKRLRPPKN